MAIRDGDLSTCTCLTSNVRSTSLTWVFGAGQQGGKVWIHVSHESGIQDCSQFFVGADASASSRNGINGVYREIRDRNFSVQASDVCIAQSRLA